MAEESFQNNFFDTEYLKADLKGRSVRGGAVTMAAQGMTFFLGMASTVVLARLLTPQDFGLITMVTAVTGFVVMFKDMGLSMATVQRSEVNHAQISTLFWINVVLSIGVMLVIAALAPAIAWFYGEPRLELITLALAGAFIFGGLTVQHQALLRRQMRFVSLAFIQIVSMLAGILTAIIAAFYGAGYWALVLMQLATAITGAIAVWVACGWRPGLPVRRSGVREMLAFGGNLTGFNFVNYFARNLDNVLIGRFWGANELGMYNKAYNLLLLPIRQVNMPITSVVIPGLSRFQKEPEKFRAFYKKGISLLVFLNMPTIAFLFVAAKEVIVTILGPQWVDATPIFRALAPAAFIGTFNVSTGWVYICLGETRRQFRWGILVASVISLSFVIGVYWGAIGIAIAYSIAICAIRYPSIVFCFRRSPLRVSDLMSTLWRPAVASMIAGVALFIFTKLFTFSYNVAFSLLINFLIYVLFYVVSCLFLPNGRQYLRDILQLAKELRHKPYAAGCAS